MRIKEIDLSWFRGAGESLNFETGSKNVVVYGANGAGKSTVVDALEYIQTNGRIGHLSHEYSGRRQEKGIRNTHAPKNTPSLISLGFQDGNHLLATISPEGVLSIESEPQNLQEIIQSWDLERFILRQDEVARFIGLSKGGKYSVLLPLLGLEKYEQACDNLRKFRKTFIDTSGLNAKKQRLEDITSTAGEVLTDLRIENVIEILNKLAKEYLTPPIPTNFEDQATAVDETIRTRFDTIEPEQRRYVFLQQIKDEKLDNKLEELNNAKQEAIAAFDNLLDRRIAVLEPTAEFAQEIMIGDGEIICPACGQEIDALEFIQHVREEMESLKAARVTRDRVLETQRNLFNSIVQLLKNVSGSEVAEWLDEPDQADLVIAIENLQRLKLRDQDARLSEERLDILRNSIPLINSRIEAEVRVSQPSTQQLVNDLSFVGACQLIPEINTLGGEIEQIETIIQTLKIAESSVRDTIRVRTEEIMDGVSHEIQRLWRKLHPDEPIEEVQLYMPDDAEKAIDICLKFYDVDQPSPRLTLSEGHRNSLGLCIFLALFQLDEDQSKPAVLDDVVSSMDREHRGRLANLLAEDFSERQIFLFTHDREWYTELHWRLPGKKWIFTTLRPWEDPLTGIQWAKSSYTFDDAKSMLQENPEAAGNRTRAIMDTQLSIVAEKLRIPVPYARGDRNDQRTCIEFINRIISEGKQSLRIKEGDKWSIYNDPIDDWENAYSLLGAWANRASHTGSLVPQEADELITACEKVLNRFRCHECSDPIWIADMKSRKRLQCQCGLMQWRYG